MMARLLPLALAAAVVPLGMAAFPFHAFAADDEVPEEAEAAATLDDVVDRLDAQVVQLEEVNVSVAGIAQAMPESGDDGGTVAGSQAMADLYYIQAASAMLLALNLGALCWLCFRAR